MSGHRRSSIAEATDLNGASPSQPGGEDDSSGTNSNLKVRPQYWCVYHRRAPLLPRAVHMSVRLIRVLGVQWLAPLAVVGGIVLLAGAGIVYKEDIKALLHAFIRVVDRCRRHLVFLAGPVRPSSRLDAICHIWPSTRFRFGTKELCNARRRLCSLRRSTVLLRHPAAPQRLESMTS